MRNFLIVLREGGDGEKEELQPHKELKEVRSLLSLKRYLSDIRLL